MMKIQINNKREIELVQEKYDGEVKVNYMDSKGKLECSYNISPGDMVMLLNYYHYKKTRNEEIF